MSGRYFRNFAVLSKKALSYSSPSITNSRPCPNRQLEPKLPVTPPMRKLGSRPPSVSSHAASDAVVVLPWVPATTMDRRSQSHVSRTVSGSERYRSPRSSTSSTSGLPRDTAFPTTTRSMSAVTFAASKPSRYGIPRAARKSLIGG